MKEAPFTKFGKTKIIPVVVYYNNKEIESDTWDEVLWVERGEDWYGLMSKKHKRVRVVTREQFIRAPQVAHNGEKG